MTIKDEASKTIFGIGPQDGCVLGFLTDRLKTCITETLLLTDELDTIYASKGDTAQFVRALVKASEVHKNAARLLPDKDIRTQLLRTTLSGYNDLGTLLMRSELGQFDGDASAIAATARIRKLFLNKILSDELDDDGRSFLNYLLADRVVQNNQNYSPVKIPLPPIVKGPNAKAHPFPAQVSIQTQEFIQAVLFYAVFADMAAGEYVRLPTGIKDIESKLGKEGLTTQEWERGWNLLQKYQPVFNNTIFQNVVILMRSHWDWYIRQIGEFVSFARSHVTGPSLTERQQKDLGRIAWKEVTRQLDILEQSCDINFDLSSETLSEIYEMSLVRNLGMHNRWEVDDVYLKRTSSGTWQLRELRTIEIGELQRWAKSLSKLINETSLQISIKYAAAPNFPPAHRS